MTSWKHLQFGLAALVVCLGCSAHEPSMPLTYPVNGTVTMEAGQPYRGGSVQFRPDSKEDITVQGEIDKNGAFRLRTLKGTTLADGAPAGFYEVAITPALGPDRK